MAINPMIFEPQPVDNYDDIKMLISPLYEKIYFRDPDTSDPIDGNHIRLKLWYWTGNLVDPYVNLIEPNIMVLELLLLKLTLFVLYKLQWKVLKW